MHKLNKKLAEWAGFVPSSDPDKEWTMWSLWGEPNPRTLIRPLIGRGQLGKGLNFSEFLDPCFKWLVPKALIQIAFEMGTSIPLAYQKLFSLWEQELENAKYDVALALCLAIEKLIDRDGSNA